MKFVEGPHRADSVQEIRIEEIIKINNIITILLYITSRNIKTRKAGGL